MNRCTWSLPESVGPIGTLVVNVRVNGVVTVAPPVGEVIVSVGLLLPPEDEPEPLPFEPHAVASSAAAPIVIANVWTRIYCSLEGSSCSLILLRRQGRCSSSRRDESVIAPFYNRAGLSGGDLVLVRESAEDLFSADPVLGEVDRLRRPGVSLSGCELADGAVRPGGVVVPQVYSVSTRRRWCSLTISNRPKSSRRRVPMILFADGVGRRGGTGPYAAGSGAGAAGSGVARALGARSVASIGGLAAGTVHENVIGRCRLPGRRSRASRYGSRPAAAASRPGRVWYA